MEVKYAENSTAENPILLLHGGLGYDPKTQLGIDGASFANELHRLDRAGVKKCTISINSPGGLILDTYSIFSAMQDVKMKVNTSNDGVAASAAGLILMGGNKVVMKDYAVLMMHNVSGGDSSPKSVEVSTIMNGSVRQIIKNRSGNDEEKVTGWMNGETWMNASQCMAHKIIDEVTTTVKKPNLQKAYNPVTNAYNSVELFNITNAFLTEESSKLELKSILSELLNEVKTAKNESPITQKPTINNSKMKSIANVLGLKDDASEESILSAVNELKKTAKEAEQSSTEAKSALTVANTALTELRNAAATSLVESAITAGKIKGKDTAELEVEKAKWLNLAKSNLELANTALSLIPVAAIKIATKGPELGKLINQADLGESKPVDEGNVPLTEEEKKYSHRDWERKNEKKLATIKNVMPHFYSNLYAASYGVPYNASAK